MLAGAPWVAGPAAGTWIVGAEGNRFRIPVPGPWAWASVTLTSLDGVLCIAASVELAADALYFSPLLFSAGQPATAKGFHVRWAVGW
jgi:hypothetical protein